VRLDASHERRKARHADYAKASAVDFAQELADVLVRARVNAGWTQKDLAARAHTTQTRISELERGAGNPTLDTIARVVSALAAVDPNVVGAVLDPVHRGTLEGLFSVAEAEPVAEAQATSAYAEDGEALDAGGLMQVVEKVGAAANSNLALAA